MPKESPLRILIADDHELIRRGIRDLLAIRPDWEVVAEANNGLTAVQLVAELKPDLAILDYSMPHLDGPRAAREFARLSPKTRTIILTMHDTEATIHEALESGARALVLKNEADQDLLKAIAAVAEGRYFFTSRVGDALLRRYLEGRSAPLKEPARRTITLRERQVMALLAAGKTNREIAERLCISIRTAESHRININRKLSFKSVAELVRYAIRHDIVGAIH